MILSFKDEGTRDVYEASDTRDARRTCPPVLWPAARARLELLDDAKSPGELLVPPGNRLERLKGNRAGQYSIRINLQYRICFTWTDKGPAKVEIVDYH
jgi:proteic killer suppression protein